MLANIYFVNMNLRVNLESQSSNSSLCYLVRLTALCYKPLKGAYFINKIQKSPFMISRSNMITSPILSKYI